MAGRSVMLAWICLINILICTRNAAGAPECTSDLDCGWNAECLSGGVCACKEDFTLSANNRDCTDSYCDDPSCVECLARQVCRRCINYVEEETGQCVDTCDDYYRLMVEGNQVGKVCPASGSVWTSMYVAIIVGGVAAVLLICLLSVACYWRIKSQRERKLRFQMLTKELENNEKAKTQKQVSEAYLLQLYDKVITDYEEEDSLSHSVRNSHLTMLQNMSSLRRHMDTLVTMYTEARAAIGRLPADSPLSMKYRNIVHHLGRVLLLLRDPDPRLTADTETMFTWALALLRDYISYKQERGSARHTVTPGSSLARLTSAFQPPDITASYPGPSASQVGGSLPGRGRHAVRGADRGEGWEAVAPWGEAGYNDLGGHVAGDVSPSVTTMSFTYERDSTTGFSTFQRDREVGEISFIHLQNSYTKPINV